MRKSIFSTACSPGPNSFPTTNFTTKLGSQGCRRKTKTRSPNDRLDYNNIDHNNTIGNSLYDFQKMSLRILITKGVLPLVPIQQYTRGTARTDIFVEVVNLASAEAMWAHFASVAVHPSQLRITGYPCAYDMHIIKTAVADSSR